MGSLERSKKKMNLWKKAIVHFLLCFVMGFLTGFAPTGKSSIFSSRVAMSPSSSEPLVIFHQEQTQISNRSLSDESLETEETEGQFRNTRRVIVSEDKRKGSEENPRRLVIVVTPTSTKNKLTGLLLKRLSNTLRLVAQPLLWIVVEKQSDDSKLSDIILRKTGIMYRHVVYNENFTDLDSEMDHQRNIALNHIEHHKLSGIVHFAGLSNFYDLSFFNEIRATEAFGAWPIAKLSANRNKVVIEGPVCDSSEVIGWHLKKMNNITTDAGPAPIHISSFAFNSSILWDPERWGRTSSAQDTSQNSLKFVRDEVLEEETNLQGIPSKSCSKVLLWDLHISKEQ